MHTCLRLFADFFISTIDESPDIWGEPCPFWFNPDPTELNPGELLSSHYIREDKAHYYICGSTPSSIDRKCKYVDCPSEKHAPTSSCSCNPSNSMCQRCYLWHIATPIWKKRELSKRIQKAEKELQNINEYLEQWRVT